MGMPLTKHRFTRVELIDGEIVQMTPSGLGHAGCVTRLTDLFGPLAGRQASLSVQNPLALAEHLEPQPDFTVLHYRADGYRVRRPGPGDVMLVIEVEDSSVDSDRQEKIPLYARAGIPEAWLVNLPVRTVRRGETLTPLRLPDLTLRADDILG